MSATHSLDAGAILPADAPGDDDTDTLTARAYRHPALGERTVVRLVPETLGEAEDLALDFLGLTREGAAPPVGRVRRESLGFPAWALVNDPANGHHALALVQDIERLSRLAAGRAGAAKDGFDELAERLGRSAPHFLPTFHEQAARVFLAHDNTRYAATFFAKARTAERVHGLPVDEERQRAVFLEFAHAGALTAGALKDYVRGLGERLTPAAAWEQFRRLTVERCATGLPPYASLPADARRLMRAAGLDIAAEERALAADLVASPAAEPAPRSFWEGYRHRIAELGADRPDLRARLLRITPSGLTSEADRGDALWLGILADSGAEALLTDAPAPAEAAGDTAPAAAEWLARWAGHLAGGWSTPPRSPLTHALAGRMAARLRAEGRPVDLVHGRARHAVDIELLDICLAAGVPVADPRPGLRLTLDRWFDAPPGERRDLAAVAADPRFAPLLSEAVGDTAGHRERARTIAAHPVLRGVLHDWLARRVAEAEAARGLPGARAAVDTVLSFASVAAEVNPEAVASLTARDLTPLLTRTLRAGIADELGWPALEEALTRFGPAPRFGHGQGAVAVTEAWPALILGDTTRAVVVGPDRVLLDHEVRIPDPLTWERPAFHWAGGELLVTWWHRGEHRAYWSARPDDVFPLGEGGRHGGAGTSVSLPLPDGGRTTGGRPLHPGDTTLPERHPVMSDGTGHWLLAPGERATGWRREWQEFDPATGARGRASLPAFIAGGVADGEQLVPEDCFLVPLPPGYEHTPLGTDGRLIGRWVRRHPSGTLTSTGVDGTTVTLAGRRGAGSRGPTPVGRLRLPGGAEPVLTVGGTAATLLAGADAADGAVGSLQIGSPGGQFAAGTPLVPPLPFWNALRHRDEAGSSALRALTDRDSERLVAAVRDAAAARDRAEREAREAGRDIPPAERTAAREEALCAAVAAVLPAVTHPALRLGVAGIAVVALRLQEAVGRLTAPRGAARPAVTGMFEEHRPPHGTNDLISAAAGGLVGGGLAGYWSRGGWQVIQQALATARILSGDPATGRPLPERHRTDVRAGGWRTDEGTGPATGADWPPLLASLPALAYRATAPGLPDDQREALLLLLSACAGAPLAGDAPLRAVDLAEPGTAHQRGGQVLRHGDRTVVILSARRTDRLGDRTVWSALDHDPSGAFGPVAHFSVAAERRFAPRPSAERLAGTVRLVRDKGPAPWRPDAVDRLAGATGLGVWQATLLLAALPQEAPAPVLATFGLKAGQADTARLLLNGFAAAVVESVGALLPADPEELWRTGPDTAAAARAWREHAGDGVAVPEEAALELRLDGTAAAVLNPAATPWLSRTSRQRMADHATPTADDPAAIPGRGQLAGAVRAIAGLAYALPYGHPARAALPGALDAVRRRLSDPGLVLDLDIEWTDKGAPTAPHLRAAHGLPGTGGAATDGLTPVGEAFVVFPWHSGTEATWLRPAGITGPDDPALGLIEGLIGPHSRAHEALGALRALLGDDLEAAVRADAGPGVPGGHAQDPTLSVPELVAEVAATHGIGEDAAALYLQLLALPDPTDRNRARWTGWRPARARRAAAELAETDLVVTAQRSRAGRRLFLPGGWLDLRAPALPLETWKSALHPVPASARAVPLIPVPRLFARAWERVTSGDAPAYEELVTRATRKARR
ncbi:hypothetical protein [Streptomyces sp. RFCAC02]|uniref:hypothetical protein n=1 Tax=Streptomyces sp. RFCAC02 TaxID=2499143 RepID=UPI001021DB05|nr:hypothetical protein [Streptomyces sp. RFCAC02]